MSPTVMVMEISREWGTGAEMALEIVTKIAMVMMVMTMTVMTVVVMMSVMEAVRKEAETAAAMTDGYSTV
jgi:ABC-type glycerol-3-phosphate transport system permease component